MLYMWSTISWYDSTCPYIMVADAGSPRLWASSIMCSQSLLDIFLGLIISLTLSTSISAPAPGTDWSPASFSLDSTSRVDVFSTLDIMSISEAERPCTPTWGNSDRMAENASS